MERKCAEVMRGDSREMDVIKVGLLKARERKRATADKHRKMQIKNVHALYEYDIEDLEVQYQNALETAKENLLEDYKRVADKAITEENERVEREQKEKEERERKEKEEHERAKASKKKAARMGTDEEEDEYVIGQRATRTAGVQDFIELGEVGGDKAAARTQTDLTKDKEKAVNERKRKLAQVTNQKLQFHKTIPRSDMRSDFVEIVGKMQKDNAKFLVSKHPAGVKVQLVDDTFTSHLVINGRKVYTADMVVVYSSLSRETFSGVITAISEEEVAVRCGSGVKFGFSVDHIRSGRVAVSRDDESIAAMQALKAASKILV